MTTNKASPKAKDLLQQEQEQEQAARLAAAEAAIFSGNFDDDDSEDHHGPLLHSTPSKINTIPASGKVTQPATSQESSLAAAAAAIFSDESTAPAPQEDKPAADNSALRLAAAAAAIFQNDEEPEASKEPAPQVEDNPAARLAAAAAAIFQNDDAATQPESAKEAPQDSQETTSPAEADAEADPAARLAAAAAAVFQEQNNDAATAESAPAIDENADPAARLAAAAAATFQNTEEPEAESEPQKPTFLPPDPVLGIPSSNLPPELQEGQRYLAKWLLAFYNPLLTNDERAQLLEITAHGSDYVKPLQDLANSIIIRETQLPPQGMAPDGMMPPEGMVPPQDMGPDGMMPPEGMMPPQGMGPEGMVPPQDMGPEGMMPTQDMGPDGMMPPQGMGPDGMMPPEGMAPDGMMPPAPQVPPIVPEEPTAELQEAIDALLQQEDSFNVSLDDPNATCSQIALLSLREFAPFMNIDERLNFMGTVLYDTDDIWGFQNMMSAVRLRAIVAERAAEEANNAPPEPEEVVPAEPVEEVRTPRVFTTRLKPEERPQPPVVEPAPEEAPKPKVTRRRTRVVRNVAAATRTTIGADGKTTTTTIMPTKQRGRRKKTEELQGTELKAAAFSALFGDDHHDHDE